MYNITSAVTCRSLAIVRSLPLPGCVVDYLKYVDYIEHLDFEIKFIDFFASNAVKAALIAQEYIV